jgi:hypothetical protein
LTLESQVRDQFRKRVLAGELAEWIGAQGTSHARGTPFHPQTQVKIERWHQTLKNRVLLENYFLTGDLERQIESFIEHYNHRRTLRGQFGHSRHYESAACTLANAPSVDAGID